jgi:hypothetical protein
VHHDPSIKITGSSAALTKHPLEAGPYFQSGSSASGQLGNLEAGALGSLTSPAISALAGGQITAAGAVVIGQALPAFTWYRAGPAGREVTGPEPVRPG